MSMLSFHEVRPPKPEQSAEMVLGLISGVTPSWHILAYSDASQVLALRQRKAYEARRRAPLGRASAVPRPGLDANSAPWSLRSAARPSALGPCGVASGSGAAGVLGLGPTLQAPTGASLLYREQ